MNDNNNNGIDNRTNANDNNKPPTYTKEGLKSLIDNSSPLNEILRQQNKYISSVLLFYQLDHFRKIDDMILNENWEQEYNETVVCR